MNTVLKIKEYNEEKQELYIRNERELIDRNTGELFIAEQIVKKSYGTKQFWKLYLMDFLQILGIFESRQLDVLIYMLENTEPANNVFMGTYDKIEKNTKISRGTIAKIMKKLQEHKFITKIQSGAWQINPRIMMKGSEFKKSLLINYYNEE